MRTLLLSLLVTSSLFAAPPSASKLINDAHGVSNADQKALDSLDQLKRVAAGPGQKAFGFDGDSQRNASTLGNGIPIFMVRLDRLAELPAAPQPEALSLLVDVHRAFYPVLCGETACSGIERVLRDGTWDSFMLGGQRFAINTISAIAALGLNPADVILVDIPAMNLHFVGFVRDDTLMFASSYDSSLPGIVRNEAKPASEILLRLRQPAIDHNRQPT